jgi:hypothetical protein
MKLVWMVIAVCCLLAAAIALWRQELNAVFVIATIGVLAWFLRYRGDLKESLTETGSPPPDDSEVDSADEISD